MEKLLARESPGQARESTIHTARRGALEAAPPRHTGEQTAAPPLLLQQQRKLIDCCWSSSQPLLTQVLPGGPPHFDLAQRLLNPGLHHTSTINIILYYQQGP
ncbi:hypothetical protein WME90_25655 [Sorangium sp. So ce375]|uniref:hypothetical protein n=1 Tax=Sorangium sp. So ce375 TaxID=3133306 RepID=UPI003F5AE6D3